MPSRSPDPIHAVHRRASASGRRYGITTLLAVGFGGLILVSVLLVLFFAVRGGVQSTRDALAELAQLTVETIAVEVNDRLSPAKRVSVGLARLMREGIIDPLDLTAAGEQMASLLITEPGAEAVAFIPQDLQGVAAHAELGTGRTMWVRKDFTGQTGAEDAVRNLAHSTDPYWGPVLFNAESGHSYLNYRAPVLLGGKPVGVFIATVTIDALSDSVARVRNAFAGEAFVLDGPARVIAHRKMTTLDLVRSPEFPLPSIEAVGDRVLMGLFDETLSTPLAQVDLRPNNEGRLYLDQEDEFVVFYRRLWDMGPVPWLVGVHYANADLKTAFNRVVDAALIGLVVTLVAVLAAIALGRRVAAPVRSLANAARQLQSAGPDGVASVEGGPTRELSDAADAFNDMIQELRQQDLIRDTFGKYVPKDVAQRLLEEGGQLPVETGLATILFSDIVGFSTLSERLPPEELIATLNEYFTVITEPIEDLGGVITQFQGDAVLATFNLPVPHSDHAANAVRAAIEIQRRLKDRRFGSGHEMRTRIGINSASITGGAVGSSGRLSYTVHGDGVNVAARVEELNKTYGTQILVSGNTRALCGDRFSFEPVGDIPIRGRSGSVQLYRLADATDSPEPTPETQATP
jgi:class 3 adenylate cyclase